MFILQRRTSLSQNPFNAYKVTIKLNSVYDVERFILGTVRLRSALPEKYKENFKNITQRTFKS